MIVTPLYDRVILRVIEDGRTKSGLYVPAIAHANSPMGRGEVVAVGCGRQLPDGRIATPVVKVGDVVWYSRPSAQAIPYDDGPPGSVVMLRETDIVAVLSELTTPREAALAHIANLGEYFAHDEGDGNVPL